jgi:hypothetical protein
MALPTAFATPALLESAFVFLILAWTVANFAAAAVSSGCAFGRPLAPAERRRGRIQRDAAFGQFRDSQVQMSRCQVHLHNLNRDDVSHRQHSTAALG